jgi:Fibronectin type-III domain
VCVLATAKDNMNTPIRDYNGTDATPFAYGNGHIRPTDAADPGLVYDNTIEDYLNFLCTLGYKASFLSSFTDKPFGCPSIPMKIEDLNYPSISVGALNKKIVVTRRLKNVGPPGTYSVQVEAPSRVDVAVRPPVLTFSDVGEEKVFNVAIMSRIKEKNEKGFKFGRLVWSDGKHQVRSTIAVNVVA